MDTPERVEAYLASQPEPKQADLRQLHAHMLAVPEGRLWFNAEALHAAIRYGMDDTS